MGISTRYHWEEQDKVKPTKGAVNYRVQVERSTSKNPKKNFFWRVVTSNGRVLLTSESYSRRPTRIAREFCSNLDGSILEDLTEK